MDQKFKNALISLLIEPDDTGYPDTLEIGTGTTQDPDPMTCPGVEQEGTFTPHKETPPHGTGSSGSEKACHTSENHCPAPPPFVQSVNQNFGNCFASL